MLAEFRFESLSVDVVLELNDIQKFLLQHLQGFFELTVFTGHLLEKFLLVLGDHQVEIRFPRNFAEFELLVLLDRRKKFTVFDGFFKYFLLDRFGKLRNLNILIAHLVLVLSFLAHNSLQLPIQIIFFIQELFAILSLSRLLNFQLILQFFDLLSQLLILLPGLDDGLLLLLLLQLLLGQLASDLLLEVDICDSLLHHEVD